jgi:hypothetical protein
MAVRVKGRYHYEAGICDLTTVPVLQWFSVGAGGSSLFLEIIKPKMQANKLAAQLISSAAQLRCITSQQLPD